MTAVATRPAPKADDADIEVPRRWKAPIAYGVVGLLALILFGFGSAVGAETSFHLARETDAFQISDFSVPSRGSAVLLAAIAAALAALSAWAMWTRRRVGPWLPSVFGVAVVLALLVWAGAGKDTTNINITGLLAGGLIFAGPLVFGSLSGLICERSGVINIAIEGQLLFGAFLAAVVASATGSAWLGLGAAPIAGALVGALLALFAVRYWVDQIVVGVVLNVLVVGITGFFFGTVLEEHPNLNLPTGLDPWPVPGLSRIPVIGPVLFDHSPLIYIMFAVVAVLHVMLFKSRWGLRVRAVGEHPKAADTVGIKVNRTRVRNTILGGAIAGLGGAFFTVAAGLGFGKEMTGGKGYIALAAMILGRWSPKGAFAAALLFGLADQLRRDLGIIGSSIPGEFISMLPYLATIFAVAGIAGRVSAPAAEGKPYKS
jgi:simple sugar transport system permease protein